MTHFVYIIYSKTADKFYIGETCNIEERISQHNSGFYDFSFSFGGAGFGIFEICKKLKKAF